MILRKLPDERFFGTVMSEFLPQVKGDYGISCISWRRPYPLFPTAFYGLTQTPSGLNIFYNYKGLGL